MPDILENKMIDLDNLTKEQNKRWREFCQAIRMTPPIAFETTWPRNFQIQDCLALKEKLQDVLVCVIQLVQTLEVTKK